MRCPTCGADGVMIHGNQWECGFCGDSGFLEPYNARGNDKELLSYPKPNPFHNDLAYFCYHVQTPGKR